MDTERPKLVLVAGTSRAGTTMLDVMLGGSRQSFSIGEVYAKFRPFSQRHAHPRCSCGRDPCPLWARLDGVPASELHVAVAERLGASAVVDSSKRLAWIVDAHRWVAGRMDVVDLLIWKEPRDLAYSYWRRSGDVRDWRGPFLTYHRRYLGLGLPFLAVRYEELVADPEGRLRTIAEAAGLPYEAGQERFWESEHHHLFGSGGVREQVERGTSEIGPTEYPSRFESEWRAIAAEVEDDPKVQRIRSRLEEHDVTRAGTEARAPTVDGVRRRWWYYRDRAGSAYRRMFPRA